jgi:acyl-CoA reductase-like NAD-dependent aldehyde dehydrogenase
MRSYDIYIDGQDVPGQGWTYVVRASAYITDVRPAFHLKRSLELGRTQDAGEDVAGRCAISTPEQNIAALEAAARASRLMRAMPLDDRCDLTIEFNRVLDERQDELIDILIAEGHPKRLAQWEVSGMLRGCDPPTIEWYRSQLHQEFTSDGRRLELIRKADGVVCVNPPQNASGSNAALGVLAVLAGNAIVVKAPRSSPLSTMFVYREILAPILDRFGAPPGTLNLISGGSGPILQGWLESPLVNDILFFGDSTAGLRLGEECLSRGKKAILELSGNDGFVVWRDADLDAAARALEECFYGSSQICMVPKYAVVHPAVAEEFFEVFLSRVERLRPGFPEDPEVLLSPVLKIDRYFDFIAEARNQGSKVLCGDERVDVSGEASTTGAFCMPTVLRVDGLDEARELTCVREETFFPLLPVIVPQSAPDDELLGRVIEFVDANPYGLRNSLWTRDDTVAKRFARDVGNGGQLKVNDSHIGFVSYLSTHGGTGRTGGPYGELNYVGLRTTHLQGISWGNGDPRPLDARVVAHERG